MQAIVSAFFYAVGSVRQILRQNFKINKKYVRAFFDSDGFFWQKENHALLKCIPKARTLEDAIFMTNYSKEFKIKAI